jgi:hypothetical protein
MHVERDFDWYAERIGAEAGSSRTAPAGTAAADIAPMGARPADSAPTGAAPTGATPTGAAPTGVRASDTERERVARILQAAAGDGLLTLEEVNERLDAAFAARFRHELTALTADLPGGGRELITETDAERRAARRAVRSALARHAALPAMAAVVLITIWALSGARFFWPAWPLAFLVLRAGRRAHWAAAGYGPGIGWAATGPGTGPGRRPNWAVAGRDRGPHRNGAGLG